MDHYICKPTDVDRIKSTRIGRRRVQYTIGVIGVTNNDVVDVNDNDSNSNSDDKDDDNDCECRCDECAVSSHQMTMVDTSHFWSM